MSQVNDPTYRVQPGTRVRARIAGDTVPAGTNGTVVANIGSTNNPLVALLSGLAPGEEALFVQFDGYPHPAADEDLEEVRAQGLPDEAASAWGINEFQVEVLAVPIQEAA